MKRNIKYFTLSFVITLIIIVPIYLVYTAIGLKQNASNPAETKLTNVPVLVATSKDATNVLLATGTDNKKPSRYYIIRLDAYDNTVAVTCILPQTIVLYGGKAFTVQDVISNAGIAAVPKALQETLNIEIPFYIYASEEYLLDSVKNLGNIRIRLNQTMSEDVLSNLQLEIAGTDTAVLPPLQFCNILNSNLVLNENLALTAATGVQSLIQVGINNLSQSIGFLLRDNSGKISTNISAADIYDLERIANYLVKYHPEYWSGILPAVYNNGRYELQEEAVIIAKEHFAPKEKYKPSQIVEPVEP